MARPADQAARDEAGAVDSEVHPREPAGAEGVEVHAVRQHGHLAAAHERRVARLRQHRLADREQHDHDADAEPEPAEQHERAEAPDQEVAEGERADHPDSAAMRPSSM